MVVGGLWRRRVTGRCKIGLGEVWDAKGGLKMYVEEREKMYIWACVLNDACIESMCVYLEVPYHCDS